MESSNIRRAHYFRNAFGSHVQVIVELLPEGELGFWEQEVGEVRWFPFVPSQEELTFALSLMEAGHTPGRQPMFSHVCDSDSI